MGRPIPSADDGEGAALRLLRRSGVITAHCPAAPRGHCLSGAGGEQHPPDFRTISDSRKGHLAALTGLFLRVLELCQLAGLVKLGHVALDGTKVKANASRHKAMSYKRMKEKEAR